MRANCFLAVTVAALAACGESNHLPAQTSGRELTLVPAVKQPEAVVERPKAVLVAESRASPVPTDLLSPAQIAARASESVVVITTPSGRGAGFVVEPNHVATCLHVVEGADRIVVRTQAGVEHTAYAVIDYDRANDLALLAVDSLAAPRLRLGDFTEVAPGDPVTVIGHPEGLESSVSTGVVSAIRTFESGRHVLQITAPISPGSSGGPVLSQKGQVIG